jgi:8-oxo-dGTP pyrophosphatase MutT (NUDIX family)
MEWKIDVTVAALIEQRGRFLLVEEHVDGDLVLNQPAGHLEAGESLLEAAIREVAEETGHTFVPESVVGVYLWQCDPGTRSFLRVCFVGTATAPRAEPKLDHGIVGVHWLTREELANPPRRLRSPMVLRCIDDLRAGARFPLSCLRYVATDPIAAAKLA